MTGLQVHQVGPGVAVQDFGRPGFLAKGLTRGGAADLLAVHEGAALLRQSPECAVLEMVGTGGTFEATQDMRVAFTGAAMTVSIDGDAVAWNASHVLPAGAQLVIGPTRDGTYGYLHVGGGFATDPILGARATHQSTGLGALVAAGDFLPVGGGDGFLGLPDPGDPDTLQISEGLRDPEAFIRAAGNLVVDRGIEGARFAENRKKGQSHGPNPLIPPGRHLGRLAR